jgi:hypothetical protein
MLLQLDMVRSCLQFDALQTRIGPDGDSRVLGRFKHPGTEQVIGQPGAAAIS